MAVALTLNTGTNIALDGVPDRCPICHFHIETRHVLATMSANDVAEVVFICPRGKCKSFFIARYNHNLRSSVYILHSLAPLKPLAPETSKEISELSPDFVATYNDASYAEQYGFSRVVGPGYRKALELLVKDYCISQWSTDDEKIKSMHLGQVIEKYIADVNIKACAKRAAWLGNDEAHYVRKWEDKDVDDMKKLIKLTEKWIETNILTAHYMGAMKD